MPAQSEDPRERCRRVAPKIMAVLEVVCPDDVAEIVTKYSNRNDLALPLYLLHELRLRMLAYFDREFVAKLCFWPSAQADVPNFLRGLIAKQRARVISGARNEDEQRSILMPHAMTALRTVASDILRRSTSQRRKPFEPREHGESSLRKYVWNGLSGYANGKPIGDRVWLVTLFAAANGTHYTEELKIDHKRCHGDEPSPASDLTLDDSHANIARPVPEPPTTALIATVRNLAEFADATKSDIDRSVANELAYFLLASAHGSFDLPKVPHTELARHDKLGDWQQARQRVADEAKRLHERMLAPDADVNTLLQDLTTWPDAKRFRDWYALHLLARPEHTFDSNHVSTHRKRFYEAWCKFTDVDSALDKAQFNVPHGWVALATKTSKNNGEAR